MGKATFEIEDSEIQVKAREGIYIEPKTNHSISNDEDFSLEFLVISQPTSRGDRTEII